MKKIIVLVLLTFCLSGCKVAVEVDIESSLCLNCHAQCAVDDYSLECLNCHDKSICNKGKTYEKKIMAGEVKKKRKRKFRN